MGIIIRETFSEVTPESAEYGDYSDSGFINEGEEIGFRELVDKLKDYRGAEPSSSGVVDQHTWFTLNCGIVDYGTCTERQESIHFADTERKAKYWIKATKAAKVIATR